MRGKVEAPHAHGLDRRDLAALSNASCILHFKRLSPSLSFSTDIERTISMSILDLRGLQPAAACPPFEAVPVKSCHLGLNWTSVRFSVLSTFHRTLLTERPSTVHVTRKLLTGSLRFGSFGELDDTLALGSVAIKQDFGENNTSDSLEQLD